MKELKDSFEKEIGRGFMGFSFIGFSGSGCTQHLRKARISYNPAKGYTIKNAIKCPGHSYVRGTDLTEIVGKKSAFDGACFCKVLTERQFEKFPDAERAIICDKEDFKKKCTGK